MDIIDLKSKIQTRIFDYQRLKSAIENQSNERRFIGSLVRKGYIIRVKKGLYLWGKKLDASLYSKELLANLIYGPSYVTLEYALSFYGLIPERVETITSITFKKKKEFITPVGTFAYEHLNSEAYSKGIKLHLLSKEQKFIIASPEKALLDTIAIRVEKGELMENVEDFLVNDLRIDMNSFKKLNRKVLLELASFYKSSSVKEFSRWLKTRKE